MSDNYSAETARIRTVTTSMVSLLEGDEPLTIAHLDQGARLLTEAYQDVLNLGTKQLVSESAPSYRSSLNAIEQGYSQWRVVEKTFARTLDLAYNGYISRDNLMADTILAQLRYQVGDRITALHAKLHASWKGHLNARPWDDFMVNDANNVDQSELKTSMKMLVQGDHLDVEDAVEELTGPLRHAFAGCLESETNTLDLMEEGLWLRPEILVINDYWKRTRGPRLMDILSRRTRSKRADGFARVQTLLSFSGPRAANSVVGELEKTRLDQRDTLYRCLLLHPDHETRRFATKNMDLEGFWKVATPHAVPCASILAMLERVARSEYFDESFQKVFFQTVNRRLFHLTARSEVLYASGIVRIFAQLPFFMEDEYFEKLTLLIDHISKKEKFFCIERGVLEEFKDELNREKDKIGTLKGQTPVLTSVPPVVLRKLARDGHYWFELSMHPMFKIARETITHINSPDRALRLAKNHVVNQDVLRAVGKNRNLFNSLPAKLALLSNPRTPPTVSIAYISDLSRNDMTALLRKGSVHPELRLQLRNRLGVR